MSDPTVYTARGFLALGGLRSESARPLSRSLERQLLRACGERGRLIEALAIDKGAPSSLSELLDATHGTVSADSFDGAGSLIDAHGRVVGERIPVWSGESDSTIWSAPAVNYLFRALHDSVHIQLGAEFDVEGELEVARVQCSRIEGKPERLILWSEIAGQVLYHAAHGAFPKNQRAFVRDCVRNGVDLTVSRGVYHNDK